MKDRLLLVTRNLPPLVGGMERLVWHMIDSLRNDYSVHVIGPEKCAAHLPASVGASEVPLRPLWRFLLQATFSAVFHSLRKRPVLVFAGSGLTAPIAWIAARLSGGRCVVYLHGLDVEAQHKIYRLLWHPFLRRCDGVLVNSRFTRGLAESLGIRSERIRLLHPGVALPDPDAGKVARRAFRESHGLGDDPVILYVGRITERKGLLPFVRHVFPRIHAVLPAVRLVVIGDEPSQALLHNDGLRAAIQRDLAQSGQSSRVHFLGEMGADDPALEAAYFAADVLVFPVQDRPGDHEGFGMVAIEAAAHGLPTVAFSAGGVTDAVADGVSGTLVEAGDNAAFAKAVIDILQSDEKQSATWTETARAFAERFAWGEFGVRLVQLCRNVQKPK